MESAALPNEAGELSEGASPGISGADSPVVTLTEAPVGDQQSGWLARGPEAFDAPVAGSRPRWILGVSALGIVAGGLLLVAAVYSLTGDPSGRPGGERITVPSTTAPQARPALPAAPMSSPAPVATLSEAPVTTPAAPVSAPEVPLTSAAPNPAVVLPSPSSRRSAGGPTERSAPAVPAPQRSTWWDNGVHESTTSQPQPPPPSAESPPPPAPTSAPEGWTRVPTTWKPQPPE